MEIRSLHYQLHFTIDLSCIENHSVCVRLLSNSKYTDACEPRSIDPLDRAGAARLAGMDRDRDRGTTTRNGAKRRFASKTWYSLRERTKKLLELKDIHHEKKSKIQSWSADSWRYLSEKMKSESFLTRSRENATKLILRGCELARIRTCPFGMRAYQHHLYHQHDVSEMHMHVYKYEHLSH